MNRKGFWFKRYVIPLLNVPNALLVRLSLECTLGFRVGANPSMNVQSLISPWRTAKNPELQCTTDKSTDPLFYIQTGNQWEICLTKNISKHISLPAGSGSRALCFFKKVQFWIVLYHRTFHNMFRGRINDSLVVHQLVTLVIRKGDVGGGIKRQPWAILLSPWVSTSPSSVIKGVELVVFGIAHNLMRFGDESLTRFLLRVLDFVQDVLTHHVEI